MHPAEPANSNSERASTLVGDLRSNELFFAVVGPVGAGGSRAIKSLERVCTAIGYECTHIKASEVIREWGSNQESPINVDSKKSLDNIVSLQDLGDRIRKTDPSSVARAMITDIARKRAEAQGVNFRPGVIVPPDGKQRVYLIDSIRHPAEISILRRTYGYSFAVIGVVCEERERKKRILGKYFTTPEAQELENIARLDAFIKRDANDVENKHGQHVSDAFFEADFFIDNTVGDERDDNKLLDEKCSRLVDIISHSKVVRPTIEETAMHQAHSARVRSACLSRQVGAALIDDQGTLIATGTNEVPAAGGGVYGEGMTSLDRLFDERCAFRADKHCSSNKEQNRIIDELIEDIPELAGAADKMALKAKIRKTSVGSLLEFTRAVHAEMDALLSAARAGTSTTGSRLFVTTFPCHYCARHIVTAGVFQVQYIEPYPKSLALELHKDAIETDETNWTPPSSRTIKESLEREKGSNGGSHDDEAPGKVLFQPFVGVAPSALRQS